MAALGILLLVAGAILVWAVEREAEGLDLHDLGWILFVGGGLALLFSLVQYAFWRSPRRSVTERHVSPDGGHYVEESRFD